MYFVFLTFDELFLKKRNRFMFINKLLFNLKIILKNNIYKNINVWNRSICYLEYDSYILAKEALLLIKKRIIGFAKGYVVCFAIPNLTNIFKKIEIVFYYLKKKKQINTFRVSAKIYNNFNIKLSSQKINEILGTKICEKLNLKVNLNNHDVNFKIFIFKNKAFVVVFHVNLIRGLPVGTSGHTLHLLSDGFDSPVAAFLLMKKGLAVHFIHFFSKNNDYENEILRIKKIIKLLKAYQPFFFKLILVNVDVLINEIKCNIKNKYSLLLLKICFYKIANYFAEELNFDCISTGESLNQVSTQTIDNLNFLHKNSKKIIITPLICFSKLNILKKAKKIKTFDISNISNIDTCAIFNSNQAVTIKSYNYIYKVFNNDIMQLLINKVINEKTEILKFK